MKSKEEVIAQFNEEVNMTAEELEAWLEDPKSEEAGTGVGIESGHKIVEILKKNPEKDPEQYDEDDLEHMRKVVGYNKRHLAQEDLLKQTKTREELENAKSTISLKNWGHDPLKTLDEQDDVDNETSADDHGVYESQTQKEVGEDTAEEGGDVDREEDIGGGEAELEDPEEPKEAKKRKLASEELEPDEEGLSAAASVEETVSLRCGDDQEVDECENGGALERVEGQDGQDEPPRKKTKNDAAQ
ncbi:hypothetical protein GSI_05921 [Ganoderma sinense ZZ0214-1]|uniref:Uncharacterized protein n=1 Tax=Ganoderma sinense ZZ0214-1 TaxID=1077348 RepID=A0A2G8SBV4_9APHY|nr:hypothetical protein GSI_05921 [Ganoderma sinense ZZ0214-1]